MNYFLLVSVIVMFLVIQVQIMRLKKAKGIMLEWENLSDRTKKLLKGERGEKGESIRGQRGQRGFSFRKETVQEMINETLSKRPPYTRKSKK